MSILAHMNRLKEKHSQLENHISLEYLRPLPNSRTLSHLKHEKLLIKDEMERLARAS